MRLKIKSILIGLLISALFYSCTTATVDRPRDTWVFRSVLDEQARMITILLHEDLYVAYNAQNGNLYKAWKGDVILEGAVYNTVHGPQPTSFGYDFYTSSEESSLWSIVKGGEVVETSFQYKGHKFENGQVTLMYRLSSSEGSVEVFETPEYSGDGVGLERRIEVSGDEGLSARTLLHFTSMEEAKDYSVSGDMKVMSAGLAQRGDVSLNEVVVQVDIPSGDDITAKVAYFLPEVSQSEGDSPSDQNLVEIGKEAVFNSDCKTCHNETEKTVGPSYLAIAEKYPFDEGTMEVLAGKVIEGGSGSFGDIPMTPHPDLDPETAKKMLYYILSLDGEEPPSPGRKNHFLDDESVVLNLSENEDVDDSTTPEPGVAVNYHKIDNVRNLTEEWVANNNPILSGVTPKIHTTRAADFGEFKTHFFIDYRGYINVDEEKNYSFRLVSDDGSLLIINDEIVIDHMGSHGPDPKDGEVILKKGANEFRIVYYQGGGGAGLSFQWRKEDGELEVVPANVLTHSPNQFRTTAPYIDPQDLLRSIPGDKNPVNGVHPSFKLKQARPDDFTPRVGGMDFLSDGRMVVCAWDSLGPVYVVEGVESGDPAQMKATMIASGLAEPLGLKVVDDEIYVLQKQELTKLIDSNGDGNIDTYETICDKWRVSANFHEFAFGLVYKEGYFYATLATAILPGGASANPQIPDRGKVVKISKDGSEVEFISHGLRTPNGIGIGFEDEVYVADNQGDWLPSSKIVQIEPGSWHGSRSVDFEGTEGLEEQPPVVWLPQDEIGNSPSTPTYINVGPYAGQMIHGEVTHGGVKRVFVEKVKDVYQGSLFRFTQGLEAGINRLVWGPDNALYVGGVGSTGNWSHYGTLWYGLQRLEYVDNIAFEMKSVSARSNGFEIELTQPLSKSYNLSKTDLQVQQWYYLPTENYGGPKMDLEDLPIESLHLSDDRTKIFVELDGMKRRHVVYIRFANPILSESGSEMWTTETWYTLNEIPDNLPGFESPVKEVVNNTLSSTEIEEGWKLLFDGSSTQGWRNFNSESINNKWVVRNGELHLTGSGGGDIVTEDEYENFELMLDWKIVVGGNSGVMWNVQEGEYKTPWLTGPEMQILDNAVHGDGRYVTHRAGDLYDMIACKFVTSNPGGEWNQMKLVSNNGKMEHWLNGYKVVEYEMHTDEWKEMVANSKFKSMPDFGTFKKGRISIQDHGDKLWLRNIKIRELD